MGASRSERKVVIGKNTGAIKNIVGGAIGDTK